MERFKTIQHNATAEVIEKKSKFIANAYYVETSKEAEEYIKQVRKKYYDARHHCFAYRTIEQGSVIDKYSDDGEPSGTAGAPMLTILQKHQLHNILVIVTRYFGGVLLGTGGLVRAYSDATIKALQQTNIVEYIDGYVMDLEIEYKDLKAFEYYCKLNTIPIIQITYADTITLKIEIPKDKKEVLSQNMSEHKFKILKNKIISNKYIQNSTF